MSKLFTLLASVLFLGSFNSNAQIFWSENFESGSTGGTLAGSYGGWSTTSTGTNGSFNNVWYVSCAENGHTSGICGTGCAATSATATLATLHIGSNSGIGGDAGASYFASSLSETNQRAMSPTINCTGKYSITMSFYYIENGDGTNDDASVWYYDGTTWSLLVNTPKTPTATCSPQGEWTHYTIALPSSANNNPNVKIGFNWTNNNDATGTDPSFAVDSVSLSVPGTGGPVAASMTASATTACQDSCITVTNTSTGTVDSARWSCSGATITTTSSTPASICFPTPGTKVVKLYLYTGGVKVDSASRTITVNPSPHPVVTKTGTTYSVPAVYATYQWYLITIPLPTAISGATNATYTTTVTGSYGIVVDSAGCKGIAYYGTLGLDNMQGHNRTFWVSQSAGSSLDLHTVTAIEELLNIGIYDATGRLVHPDVWNKGTDSKQIYGLSLPSGLYIIRLNNSNTSSVLKWQQQ